MLRKDWVGKKSMREKVQIMKFWRGKELVGVEPHGQARGTFHYARRAES
jgi:hypothetical protein